MYSLCVEYVNKYDVCSKLSVTATISFTVPKSPPVWIPSPLMDPCVFIYWTQVGVSN